MPKPCAIVCTKTALLSQIFPKMCLLSLAIRVIVINLILQSFAMNKSVYLMVLATSLSVVSFAQTVKENVDKAARQPARNENAAKADVRLHDKKVITDTSSLKPVDQVSFNNKKKKKKSCNRKSSK